MPQTIDNMTATWNSGGTTFTGIRFNVTDTASAAATRLVDLQVSGFSLFNVSKAGVLSLGNTGSGTTFQIAHTNNNTLVFGSTQFLRINTSNGLEVYGQQIGIGAFGSGSVDLSLFRDAADTLAQRRGVNAQTSRIYGTFTDASNYRRVAISVTTGGVASIKPEGAGTGASGNVLHISGLPTANPGPGILWDDGGTVKVGT